MVQRLLYAVVIGLEAFPLEIRASAVESASNAPAPANLLSPSESDQNRPPSDEPTATPLGFGPFQRFQLWKPGHLGFTSPDTFRLQGFTPSCRFTSSSTLRPCFMPVTLLGFSFRAFSPRRAFAPFGVGDLRGVGAPGLPAPGFPGMPSTRATHLQGFALREDSPPSAVGLTTVRRPLPSWCFDL